MMRDSRIAIGVRVLLDESTRPQQPWTIIDVPRTYGSGIVTLKNGNDREIWASARWMRMKAKAL